MSVRRNELDSMTDTELLGIIHSESPDASMVMDYFLEKYKGVVLHQARPLFLVGADRDDLLQEGMIGLYKAVREYDPDKSPSFNTFARTVVYQQMCNAINASNRKKNQPLNEYVSFYTPLQNNDTSVTTSLLDIMEALPGSNPEDFVIDKENAYMIEYELGERLSSFEKLVFDLYIEGMDYRQIAEELKRPPKAIDNAIQRIRNKLTALLGQA